MKKDYWYLVKIKFYLFFDISIVSRIKSMLITYEEMENKIFSARRV